MKKSGILNPQLSRLLAEMGHTDLLVIADAGLPLPLGVERIDLSLVPGVPGFVQTLEVILEELAIEGATLAGEIRTNSPAELERTLKLVALEPQFVSHAEFKAVTHRARAIVRTGECTPYCNIILHAGVHDAFRR
jgi:D-ribose pyranase